MNNVFAWTVHFIFHHKGFLATVESYFICFFKYSAGQACFGCAAMDFFTPWCSCFWVVLSSNLALVNFFRLEGWHLLLMNLIFFSAFFICGLAFSRGRVSLKVNCNVFTSWFLMMEFGPQKKVSKLFWKISSFSRYRPSKSGTSAGSIVGFTRFPKIITGKLSSVMSQVIKAPWSVQSAVTYVTAKQVETAKFDGFWKKYGSLCCLWLPSGSRKTKCISSHKFRADNQRRKQAVTTWVEGFVVKDHSKPHRSKLRSDTPQPCHFLF